MRSTVDPNEAADATTHLVDDPTGIHGDRPVCSRCSPCSRGKWLSGWHEHRSPCQKIQPDTGQGVAQERLSTLG